MKPTFLHFYLLLAMILTAGSARVTAQPYKSVFGDTLTYWSIRESGLTTGTRVYVTKGDTVVNGLDYKKHGQYAPSKALLREDTMTGKVWCRGFGQFADTMEYLVMDMGMQKGDTFRIPKFNSTELKTVDTVYIESGRKHVRFAGTLPFPAQSYYFEFVEGIGTTYGLAYKHIDPVTNKGFLCSFHDSVKIYTSPFDIQEFNNNCFPPSSVEETANDRFPVLLYPNPAGNTLNIELPKAGSGYSYRIINSLGRRLLKNEIKTNSKTSPIDITGLAAGHYYLQVLVGDEPMGSYPFSKQ